MLLLKKQNRIISYFIILLILFVFLALDVRADNLGDAFSSSYLHKTVGGAGYNTTATLQDIISALIAAVLSLLGVIFLVLMVYGGFLWMTAQGKEEIVTKAKDLITQAIIGLVIVLAAYAISWLIINKLGGATLDQQ